MAATPSLCHQLSFARLWLEPIYWTAKYLDRAGVKFENVDSEYRDYVEDKNWAASDPWVRLVHAVSPSLTELFAVHPDASIRLQCLREILSSGTPWKRGPFPDQRDGRPFFFQDFIFKRQYNPEYQIFSHRKYIKANLSENPPRFVGYFNYENVETHRKALCPSTGWDCRYPWQAPYFASHLALITPPSWMRDPYFLFLLLGMAQGHRLKFADVSFSQGLTTRLLVHNWKDDPDHIYLYQATFDIGLVDSLIDANKTRFNLTGSKILWKRISLKPYNSFPQRLQDQLLNSALQDPQKTETSANRGTSSQLLSKDPTKSTPTEISQQTGLQVSKLFSEQKQLKRKETSDNTDAASTATSSIKSKRKRTNDSATLWQPDPTQTRMKRKEKENDRDKNKDKYGRVSRNKKRKNSAKGFISDRTRSKTRKEDGQPTNIKQNLKSKKKKSKTTTTTTLTISDRYSEM